MVPCVDEIVHVEKSTLEQSTSQGKPCNHEDHDACTPFCVCSCCGIVVVLSNIIFDSQPNYITETEFLSSYKASTSSFTQSFWQPPKLS
jgi:hypothetical protein